MIEETIMSLQLLNKEVDNYHGAQALGAVVGEFRVLNKDVMDSSRNLSA